MKNAYLRVLDFRLRGNDERIAVYDQTSQIQKLSCPETLAGKARTAFAESNARNADRETDDDQ